MLFTESELNINNGLAILENAEYLSEDESLINPKTVPVTEVSRLGYGVVRFDDVDRLAESYGIDYIDAMYAIAEASDMNPEYLAVSVPEEDIIAYPEIVNELANIVVQPLSEDSLAYQYVDMCLEAWDNTGDENYLEAIVEDYFLDECVDILNEGILDTVKTYYGKAKDQLGYTFGSAGQKADVQRYSDARRAEKKTRGMLAGLDANDEKSRKAIQMASDEFNAAARNVGKGTGFFDSRMGRVNRNRAIAAGAVFGAAGLAAAARYAQQARNKPKSWIGKKVAALRSIYQKWMQQAQKNPQKAGIIKSAAAKLLSIIDALLAQMQRAAG